MVVPVLDDAEELRGLLQALARQTLPSREIIVLDNGSRDGSAEVARAASCTVLSEKRPGFPAPRSSPAPPGSCCRPLSVCSARQRGERALRTLRRNWRMQRPWERWAARLSAARAPRRVVGARPAAP